MEGKSKIKKGETIKKVSIKNKVYNKILIALVIFLIVLTVLIIKKPSITGKVVLGEEKIYSENLNIEKNQSGTYEWAVKNPGRITSLKATGSVTANGSAKVYIEKNGTKYLLFDSTKQLFDINIRVLSDYKKVVQGEKILVEIALLNLRGFGAGNVDVKYSIRDSRNSLLAFQEETTYVETQAKVVRELLLPEEIKPATYVAFVDVSREGTKLGSSSDTFEVVPRFGEGYGKGLVYYLIGMVLLVAITVTAIYSSKSLRKIKKGIEMQEKEPEEKTGKFELELKAIEDAYNSGFVSQQSYEKEKERIRSKISQMKEKPKGTHEEGFIESK